MSQIQFGARHVFTLQTHPTLPDDRRIRQQLKSDLNDLATMNRFGYHQDEYRTDPDESGRTFRTEITIDTGNNQRNRATGQTFQNYGDPIVTEFSRRQPQCVGYNAWVYDNEVDYIG